MITVIFITIVVITYSINNVSSKYSSNDNVVGILTSIEFNDNNYILNVKGKENIIVYYYGNNIYKLGDKLQIKGKLERFTSNTIFNQFNYKEYLLSKNTYYYVRTNNISLIRKNNKIIYNIKEFLINRINAIDRSGYLKAFILGSTNNIDSTILESYRINGISHLFSISGMHISILAAVTLFILNKIKKHNINYIFVSVFLIFYMFLTNFTPSVIRATCLFIILILNKLFKLNLSTIRILLLIMCLNLIINPYNIYNNGFQFSYIISIYLVAFNRIISRTNNYFFKVFITSFISFLVSIPILINSYFSINIMTILNNIIFVPLISLLIFPLSLIVIFIPKLSSIYNILILLLEKLSIFISNFKLEIVLCKINIVFIVLYYFVITLILYKVYKKKYKCLIIIIIIIYIHANINYLLNNLFVSFIDVGQGDSSIIHLPYNKGDILIDTGGNYKYDKYKEIINYFKSNGISRLNYLVITHGDFDHMGEAINLVNNFKVEKVIFNCGPYNNLEQELIKVLDKKRIPYYSCIKELNIDNNKLYFLQTKEYDNENDNSNVIYTKLNGYKFMFMGDASTTTEKEIMNKYDLPDIDVLKVGHHGSKTSSGKEFIDEIKPKYSIISVGKNNRYGHPNKEVLENLKDSKIYRTDQDGSIMFNIKNNKLNINTCAP